MKVFRIVYAHPLIDPTKIAMRYEIKIGAKDEEDAKRIFDRAVLSTSKLEIISCTEEQT